MNTMIYLMKRAVLLAAALLSLSIVGPAVAQQTELAPEHLALARKYVDLTDKSSIYEVALVETAVETMKTIVAQNPEIVQPVDDAITKTLEFYKGKKGDLLDQFARVYALNFTVDELKEIVAFYESPVGNKLATANATLNQSLQDVMKVFQINLKQEFFAKVRAELKAAGYNL
ncbi:MAG TPA: DUF2059 domain-containing protein [Alphaproteobacteria bacterium]|nr:DUF2059 domain-containing protein [Alphaproteobacteria bacterium]